MKKLLLSVTISLLFQVGIAQTVIWEMRPADYSSITAISKNLYKVVRNGKIGMIRANGTVVAEANNDCIYGFYEGKALLTANDGHGERITGCITDDGRYYGYIDKYYTLTGQKFFSDGLLSVSNEYGKVGYIDVLGNEILGFDGKYDRIKPFVDGHAAVFRLKEKGKEYEYSLIDKGGTPARFQFRGVGKVHGGTNSYNGIVCVWDNNGTAYLYDINNPAEKLVKRKDIKIDLTDIDYLYRLKTLSSMGRQIPYVDNVYTGTKGFEPILVDGKYGFKNNNHVILPCHLDNATPFVDGYSVITINGANGIIGLLDDETFSIAYATETKEYYVGHDVLCSFSLSVPHVWKGKSVKATVKDSAGKTILTERYSDKYTFHATPKDDNPIEFKVEVLGESLVLYEQPMTFHFARLCDECGERYSVCNGNHTLEEVDSVASDSNSEKPIRRVPKPRPEKKCQQCGKPISKCPYDGKHKTPKEDNCKVCGRPLSKCPKGGLH